MLVIDSMPFIFVVIFNLIIVIINLFICFKLWYFRRCLISLNKRLETINEVLPLALKEVSLSILLTGFEVQKIKNNYVKLEEKVMALQQTKIVIFFIYRLFKRSKK